MTNGTWMERGCSDARIYIVMDASHPNRHSLTRSCLCSYNPGHQVWAIWPPPSLHTPTLTTVQPQATDPCPPQCPHVWWLRVGHFRLSVTCEHDKRIAWPLLHPFQRQFSVLHWGQPCMLCHHSLLQCQACHIDMGAPGQSVYPTCLRVNRPLPKCMSSRGQVSCTILNDWLRNSCYLVLTLGRILTLFLYELAPLVSISWRLLGHDLSQHCLFVEDFRNPWLFIHVLCKELFNALLCRETSVNIIFKCNAVLALYVWSRNSSFKYALQFNFLFKFHFPCL